MNLANSPVNWFDCLVVVMLLLGFRQGRKNGMSQEMIPTGQWLAIIFAGAFLYQPLGDMLSQSSPMTHLSCYIAVYIGLAIVVKIAFTLVKKSLGGKLVESSVFGGAEYYLGMISGSIRFSCILLAVMALLNAPYYSPQEVAFNKAKDLELYGSNFFPGIASVQSDVFRHSLIGSLVKDRASFLLISSTKPEVKQLKKRQVDLP
jgi:uncharacterized membrane protein required for colicin V production